MPRTLDRAKLSYASILVRGRAPTVDELARWTRPGVAAAIPIDEMVADPFFAETVAPAVLFKNNLFTFGGTGVLSGYVLSSADIGGRDVLYLKQRCKPRDVVSVAPWWDLANPVAVCRDSIQASIWNAVLADGTRVSCDSAKAAPKALAGSRCGCGPNLLRCMPAPLMTPVFAAIQDEVRATAAHVVASDEPLENLFLARETVRSRLVELLYLRGIAEAQKLADPAPLLHTADGWADRTLAPRQELEPGQHAGVLTTQHLLYQSFDPRQRMRVVYEAMWCGGESAPGARPEDVLSLHTPELSMANEGWQELAQRPICTHCHARLDYGMQFFLAYPPPTSIAAHFVPGVNVGKVGPLYAKHKDDPRGQGPLTPRSFADLATSQPEFVRCMAKNAVEYVHGPRTTDALIDRVAGSTTHGTMRMRALMRAALLDLFECASCEPGPPRRPAGGPQPVANLDALLEDHCTACHHDGADVVNLERPIDPRRRARALSQVLAGRMPPDGGLAREARMQFLRAMAPDPAGSAVAARSLLAAHSDPSPALPLLAARSYIHSLSPQPISPGSVNTLEVALDGKDNVFTPNYALILSLDSYDACRTSADGPDACLDRVLRRIIDLARGDAPR